MRKAKLAGRVLHHIPVQLTNRDIQILLFGGIASF